jgi:hypothetical protein
MGCRLVGVNLGSFRLISSQSTRPSSKFNIESGSCLRDSVRGRLLPTRFYSIRSCGRGIWLVPVAAVAATAAASTPSTSATASAAAASTKAAASTGAFVPWPSFIHGQRTAV